MMAILGVHSVKTSISTHLPGPPVSPPSRRECHTSRERASRRTILEVLDMGEGDVVHWLDPHTAACGVGGELCAELGCMYVCVYVCV